MRLYGTIKSQNRELGEFRERRRTMLALTKTNKRNDVAVFVALMLLLMLLHGPALAKRSGSKKSGPARSSQKSSSVRSSQKSSPRRSGSVRSSQKSSSVRRSSPKRSSSVRRSSIRSSSPARRSFVRSSQKSSPKRSGSVRSSSSFRSSSPRRSSSVRSGQKSRQVVRSSSSRSSFGSSSRVQRSSGISRTRISTRTAASSKPRTRITRNVTTRISRPAAKAPVRKSTNVTVSRSVGGRGKITTNRSASTRITGRTRNVTTRISRPAAKAPVRKSTNVTVSRSVGGRGKITTNRSASTRITGRIGGQKSSGTVRKKRTITKSPRTISGLRKTKVVSSRKGSRIGRTITVKEPGGGRKKRTITKSLQTISEPRKTKVVSSRKGSRIGRTIIAKEPGGGRKKRTITKSPRTIDEPRKTKVLSSKTGSRIGRTIIAKEPGGDWKKRGGRKSKGILHKGSSRRRRHMVVDRLRHHRRMPMQHNVRRSHRHQHVYRNRWGRMSHRIIWPTYYYPVYYNYGSWYGYHYVHPYYHRKYVFVSLGGWWPINYSYARYYWYGWHPYSWYGSYPIAQEVQSGTNNYYTYNNYYDDGSSQPNQYVDENTFADVRERLAQQQVQNPDAQTLADTLFEEGVKAFEAGDYSLAIEKFEEATALSPDDVILPFAYSQALFAAEKYSEAAEVLRLALNTVTPEEQGVFYPRGLYDDDEVLFDQIDRLSEEASRYSFDGDLQLLLGYHLLGIGEIEEAEAPLLQAQQDIVNTDTAQKLLDLLGKIKVESAKEMDQ